MTRAFVFLPAAAAALLLAACAAPAPPAALPPQPLPPAEFAPVDLPSDDAEHGNRIEWWYYSGHLEVQGVGAPRTLGYHYALFRYQDIRGNVSFAAHASVTDAAADPPRHYHGFTAAQPGPVSAPDCDTAFAGAPLLRRTGADWCLEINPRGGHRLAADFPLGEDPFGLDLNLMQGDRPPIIHNRSGVIEYLGWSYYYSYPAMPTVGTITLDGVEHAVSGATWYDHQWGEFYIVGSPAGWQWFAVTLEDGSALKITAARDAAGRPALRYATIQDAEGVTTHVDGDGVELTSLDTWRSAETGAEYPSGWRARIPSLDLDLTLTPVLPDQENTTVLPRAAIYWEGQLLVEGRRAGAAVAGRAYGELAGYVAPEPIEWRERAIEAQ